MGMLERDQTYNDVLDRIERVEARVEDLRDVARPTEVIIYENPEWQALFVKCECCRGPRDLTKFLPVTIEEARTWADDHPTLGL